MSMTPAEVERKVHQLDNDVQSIYEMLSAIQGTQTRHTNRLKELDEKVSGVDTRVAGLDTRIAGLDSRIAGLDSRVAGLATQVTGLDSKMDTVLELLRSR